MLEYSEAKGKVLEQGTFAQDLAQELEVSGVDIDSATLLDSMARHGLVLAKAQNQNYASLAYFIELGMNMDTMLDQLGIPVP